MKLNLPTGVPHPPSWENTAAQPTDIPMFIDRKVHYSTLFTNLVGWHAGAVSLPPIDVSLAQLACPHSDITFYLHSGITNLSLYKHLDIHTKNTFASMKNKQNLAKSLFHDKKS
jgi:hypothetical protein